MGEQWWEAKVTSTYSTIFLCITIKSNLLYICLNISTKSARTIVTVTIKAAATFSGARGGQRGSRGAGALCRVERAARRVDQDGLATSAAVHEEEQQEETEHRRQLWL